MPRLEFGWDNVTKPTPMNVQRWLRITRRLLVTAGSITFFTKFIVFTFIAPLIQQTLEEIANYLTEVATEGEKQRTTIDVDAEVQDQVKISTETVHIDKEGKEIK